MSIIIKGGHFFDGLNDIFKENTYLQTKGNKISHMGTTVNTEETAEVLDAEGCYILPGLINAHVHLAWDAGPDPESLISDQPDSFVSLVAASEAIKHLSLGITTVRDTGSPGTSVLALRDSINMGIIVGPNVVASGPPIAMTGGHIYRIALEADGVDKVRAAARLNIKSGVDLIKLMATGGVYTEAEEPGSPQLMEEEMRAGVEEANKAGKKAAAHAEGLEGIKSALRAGVNCIEHGIYADDEAIEMMVKQETYLVPTMICFVRMIGETAKEAGVPDYAIRKAEEVVAAHKISFRRAVKAGVKIATGTDSGAPLNPPSDYYTELELMSEGGMSNFDILKACTSNAAEAIGLEEAGVLKEGKNADIIVVEGNPLDDLNNLKNIKYIIKGGEIFHR